jgi:hypothetical protein
MPVIAVTAKLYISYTVNTVLAFNLIYRPSRKREALAARSQMGRWTYIFTRCSVSVAAYSETKISLNNKVARVETAVRSRDAL